MNIAVLHARIRLEEKLLLAELEKRSVDIKRFHIEALPLSLDAGGCPEAFEGIDALLERCISHSRALAAIRVVESWGIPCVNPWRVAEVCGDKLATNLQLSALGVPTPRARVAFTPESALVAIEELGYPAVLKPAVGSWGRLLARVNDREAAEAILEHKATLGTYHHSIFYVQEHIQKPGRDLRAFVVGEEVIGAIARHSEHWITNTAKGSEVTGYPVTDELREVSLAAARAVGGGILAVDLFESERGLLVCEVNYTMEFKNSIEPTGVDIPARVVDYLLEVAEGRELVPVAPESCADQTPQPGAAGTIGGVS
jgi:[lysine-biosynthesis-protein LysW]--L-2-aminoadipate ligase